MIAQHRLSHVGVAVPEMTAAIAAYQRIFGYQIVSGPFDDPVQKVKVCFLGTSSTDPLQIELVAPLGDDSPVNRLLSKGGGAYHVCYAVQKMEEAIQQAREQGCVLISGPAGAVAYGGKRIAWLYTPTRQLFELVES